MSEALKREELYALVWSEPMIKVAARFDVSASYLARICSLLNVPRPSRGYWAKSAFGKAPAAPGLPDPRPGDPLEWVRGEGQPLVAHVSPKPPTVLKKVPDRPLPVNGEHPLVKGALPIFKASRLAHGSSYLKPRKFLLVDLVVSQSGIERALVFANQLFWGLEAFGHRVVIAPVGEQFRRAPVDPREKQQNTRRHSYDELWLPGRCTVVYVGTVAIGLTIIEMLEQAEARYANGAYVRASDYVAPKRRRYAQDHSWTAQHDFATGRLRLQAFSPYPGANWVRQWSQTKECELAKRIPAIVKELQAAAADVARLAEEAAQKAEVDRQRREEEYARWQREEAMRRAAEAQRASKKELHEIVERWAEAQRITRFFDEAEERIHGIDPTAQRDLLDRLEHARKLIGTIDALDHLRAWKAPNER